MIDILRKDHFLEFLGLCEGGRLAFSFFADLDLDGTATPCHVKAYGKFTQQRLANGLITKQVHKGLINELIGYELALCTNYNVAERAGIIGVPKEALVNPPDWIDQDVWPCFFSTLIDQPSLNLQYARSGVIDHRSLAKRLRSSPYCPAIVAFDEWVLNVDRNTGNLLESSDGNFYLIDHGEIFGGHNWLHNIILRDAHQANKRNLIAIGLGESITKTLPFKSSQQKAHEEIHQHYIINKKRSEFITQISKLFSKSGEQDWQSILQFLEARSNPDATAKNIGLLY